MKFTQRKNKPTSGNKWFTSTKNGGYSNCTTDLANPFFKGATVANCVGYCWGRYFEAAAQNGKLWEDQKQMFSHRVNGNPPAAWETIKESDYWHWYVSDTPEVGAVAYYVKDSKPSSGHVSFVEKVYSNGNVDFSNCNYSTKPLFKYQTNVNPKSSFNGFTLLGYLRPCVDKWHETLTTTTRLRLRNGPGTGYDILGVIEAGQKVNVVGFPVDGWQKITVTIGGKSYTGYSDGTYLK